jgi:hypothetical protein
MTFPLIICLSSNYANFHRHVRLTAVCFCRFRAESHVSKHRDIILFNKSQCKSSYTISRDCRRLSFRLYSNSPWTGIREFQSKLLQLTVPCTRPIWVGQRNVVIRPTDNAFYRRNTNWSMHFEIFTGTYKINELAGYDNREMSHKIMLIHIGKYGSCFVSFIAAPNTTNLSHRNHASSGTSRECYSVPDSYKRRYATRKNYVIEMCKWPGSKAPHTFGTRCATRSS